MNQETKPNSPEVAERRSFWFSFGVERLGLVPLKAPLLSVILIALISALAIPGVFRMSVDDSLSELFRTETEEFRQFEQVSKRFPSTEFDVLVVVEHEELPTPANLEKLRDLVLELHFAPALRGIVSLFSVREAPDESGIPAPLFPAELPQGEAFEKLMERVNSNEIIRGKLLSEDGTLALIVMALDRAKVQEIGLKEAIGEIQKIVDEQLDGSPLEAHLSGAPVMQLEIRNAVQRDRLIYNGLGFAVGAVIAFIFFRSFTHMLIAVAGPAAAVLWSLGAIGYLGFELNLFVNVITPLIIVNGFSDSMHLVFNIRRELMAGASRIEAARSAVINVAPACFLTALTAAIALAAFIFAKSALIHTFGAASTLAVILSYVAVVVVVPTLSVFLLHREAGSRAMLGKDTAMTMLARISERLMAHVGRYPAAYVGAGVIMVALCGAAYSSLEAHYRLADQVPDEEQALAATSRLDEKLTGASPVHVMIEWRDDRSLYANEVLQVISKAHAIVEKQAGVGNVWSVESLRRWLAEEAGDPSIATLKKYVGMLPEHLTRRFIAVDEKSVIISGRLPDIDASEILPVVDHLDQALDPVRKDHPGFEISVTGLTAIAARNSSQMIWELNFGLISDVAVVVVFLGLAFRSVFASVVSILPSLFPIFATGALLWVTGDGLHFASIIALTVAFGLALDSTIHFLNRYDIEERDPRGGYRSPQDALARTARIIGPVLILTTIILALGLGVTILSNLPSLRVFGQLSGATLFAALLAQLVILPASVTLFRKAWKRR